MKLTLNFKNQNVILFLIRLSHHAKLKAIYFIGSVISPMPSNESRGESIKVFYTFSAIS